MAALRALWAARQYLVMLALAVAAAGFYVDGQHVRRDRDAERVAHRATVANYRIAAAQAQRADQANAARVATDQARITQEISRDYQTRLADARARADALRVQLAQAAADPGRGAAAPVPGSGAAPGRPDGAAPPDRLPDAVSLPALTLNERLLATEQAIQLDALQRWVAGQAAVAMNGEAPR